MRRRFAALVALAALAAAGCGTGRSPVHGQVTYDDSTPVPAGTVIGEATVGGRAVSVQGTIGPDGRFSRGADKPGDGALPGTYRVAVMPIPPGDAERAAGKRPAVDGKYTRFENSGITFEVRPGSNDFPITLARPKAKPTPEERDD